MHFKQEGTVMMDTEVLNISDGAGCQYAHNHTYNTRTWEEFNDR